ncbi:hypothetical protein [Calidithermus chliarophilus]|uniref:hypothetical protein n=1 Tax=Calidithermus chliarophilus TaxID=52023 RepID=UPI00041A80B2|nr:hypothetical protein [Calidithermus chliarophilus]
MKRIWLSLGLAVVGLSLVAQGQPPAGCKTPEHRQFDFWIGEWDVFSPGGARIGSSTVEGILDGCALVENWQAAGGGGGKSFNAYVVPLKKWHQFWVASNGGTLEMYGTFQNGKMVLETPSAEGAPLIIRYTWNVVDGDKDRVRQFSEQSRDGGKTWSPGFDGLYVRRK